MDSMTALIEPVIIEAVRLDNFANLISDVWIIRRIDYLTLLRSFLTIL